MLTCRHTYSVLKNEMENCYTLFARNTLKFEVMHMILCIKFKYSSLLQYISLLVMNITLQIDIVILLGTIYEQFPFIRD